MSEAMVKVVYSLSGGTAPKGRITEKTLVATEDYGLYTSAKLAVEFVRISYSRLKAKIEVSAASSYGITYIAVTKENGDEDRFTVTQLEVKNYSDHL